MHLCHTQMLRYESQAAVRWTLFLLWLTLGFPALSDKSRPTKWTCQHLVMLKALAQIMKPGRKRLEFGAKINILLMMKCLLFSQSHRTLFGESATRNAMCVARLGSEVAGDGSIDITF